MSNKKLEALKELSIIEEAAYKMQKKLSSSILLLKLERETHVPDLMTRIRILPGVAVVAQKDKVARFFDGDAQLQISVKYLPRSEDILKSIRHISKMIKNLPGVKTVAVETYNKRKLSIKGKKIIF
tara:strand:+ start:119 stop:496 length:378 start_codon:yes stop_codon:yes gene_type:complete